MGMLEAEARTSEGTLGGPPTWLWGGLFWFCDAEATVPAALAAVAGASVSVGQDHALVFWEHLALSPHLPSDLDSHKSTFRLSPPLSHQPGCISQKTAAPSLTYHGHLACQAVCTQPDPPSLVSALSLRTGP